MTTRVKQNYDSWLSDRFVDEFAYWQRQDDDDPGTFDAIVPDAVLDSIERFGHVGAISVLHAPRPLMDDNLHHPEWSRCLCGRNQVDVVRNRKRICHFARCEDLGRRLDAQFTRTWARWHRDFAASRRAEVEERQRVGEAERAGRVSQWLAERAAADPLYAEVLNQLAEDGFS